MKFLKISEEQELAEHKECGIKMALGEKIASWLLVAMITYLVIAK